MRHHLQKYQRTNWSWSPDCKSFFVFCFFFSILAQIVQIQFHASLMWELSQNVHWRSKIFHFQNTQVYRIQKIFMNNIFRIEVSTGMYGQQSRYSANNNREDCCLKKIHRHITNQSVIFAYIRGGQTWVQLSRKEVKKTPVED